MAYWDEEDERRATLGFSIPSAALDDSEDGLMLLSSQWAHDLTPDAASSARTTASRRRRRWGDT